MVPDAAHSMAPADRTALGGWRVATRLNFLILFGFLGFAIVSGLTYGGNAKLGESLAALTAIDDVAAAAANAKAAIHKIGRLQDRFLGQHDTSVLTAFNAETTKATAALKAGRLMPPSSPANTLIDTLSDGLAEHAERFRALARGALDADAGRDAANAEALRRLQEIFSYLESTAEALTDFTANAGAEAADQTRRTHRLVDGLILTSGAVLAFMFLGIGLLLAGTVSRPLADVAEAAVDLVRGVTEVPPPALGNADDIGRIARALDLLRTTIADLERRLDRISEADVAGPAPDPAASGSAPQPLPAWAPIDDYHDGLDMALRFGRNAAALASASARLRLSAETLASSEARTHSRASTVATAAGQAADHARAIAGSVAELARALSSIAHEAAKIGGISRQAADDVQRAGKDIESVTEIPAKVAAALTAIETIADEAHMLGLNLSLQATRGGDGRPEAPAMASRMKDMARRTGRIVGDIRTWVATVETAARSVDSAIWNVDGALNDLREMEKVASAQIDHQVDTVQRLTQTVEAMAAGSTAVADSVSRMAAASGEAEGAARFLLDAAQSVERQSDSLERQIEDALVSR